MSKVYFHEFKSDAKISTEAENQAMRTLTAIAMGMGALLIAWLNGWIN